MPENVRERLEIALDASIDGCARCKVCDTQIGAAMKVLAPILERAERAEAKLAAVEAPAIMDALRHALSYVEHVPHPSSQTAAERYRSALAITGTGEKPPARPEAPAELPGQLPLPGTPG